MFKYYIPYTIHDTLHTIYFMPHTLCRIPHTIYHVRTFMSMLWSFGRLCWITWRQDGIEAAFDLQHEINDKVTGLASDLWPDP